ncbi:MAG: hypothetical protein WCQ41_02390 [Bacillota bacterium]
MKKVIAIVVAMTMVLGIASISFAAPVQGDNRVGGAVKCDPIIGPGGQPDGGQIMPIRTFDPNRTPGPIQPPMPRPTCPVRPTPPNSGGVDQTPMPRPTCPVMPTPPNSGGVDQTPMPRPTWQPPVKSFTIFAGTTTAKAFVRVMVGKKMVAMRKAKADGSFSIKVWDKKLKGVAKVDAFILKKMKKHRMMRVFVDVTLTSPIPTSDPTPVPDPTPTPVPNSGPVPTPEPTVTQG